MASLVNTLFRTILLDDSAFAEWRERPNLFLRGIVLILIVTLIVSSIAFITNMVNLTKPVDMVIEDMEEGFAISRKVMEDMMLGGLWGIPDPEFQQGISIALEVY